MIGRAKGEETESLTSCLGSERQSREGQIGYPKRLIEGDCR
jgi:hypothetical protein